MKLKVYKEKEAEEKIVRLALVEQSGYIVLRVVDEDGFPHAGGNILMVNSSGSITRLGGIASDLGFQLDDRRRVVTVE